MEEQERDGKVHTSITSSIACMYMYMYMYMYMCICIYTMLQVQISPEAAHFFS